MIFFLLIHISIDSEWYKMNNEKKFGEGFFSFPIINCFRNMEVRIRSWCCGLRAFVVVIGSMQAAVYVIAGLGNYSTVRCKLLI